MAFFLNDFLHECHDFCYQNKALQFGKNKLFWWHDLWARASLHTTVLHYNTILAHFLLTTPQKMASSVIWYCTWPHYRLRRIGHWIHSKQIGSTDQQSNCYLLPTIFCFFDCCYCYCISVSRAASLTTTGVLVWVKEVFRPAAGWLACWLQHSTETSLNIVISSHFVDKCNVFFIKISPYCSFN